MLLSIRSSIPGAFAAVAVFFLSTAQVRSAPPERDAGPAPSHPPSAETSAPAINIFLNAPTDLEGFWKKLGQPDFILLRGDALQRRLDRAKAGAGDREATLPASVVESVEVRGEVSDDLADLKISFGVSLHVEGPVWASIRLDDQVLVSLREGDRDLPRQFVPGKGWQVELRGEGRHEFRVDLKVRLKSTAEGHRLECAIPEAGRTDFELDVPQRVSAAETGPNEPVSHQSVSSGQRTRLSAKLTARSRLAVSWRPDAETGSQLPPLLSIQGEIGLDVEPGSFRTRSSWTIQSVRGMTKSLEFQIDPDDEVLELELDGQSPPASVEGGTKIVINLVEPLQPGSPKRLIMTTRRALAAAPSQRLSFGGFALINAREQSGAIGIVRSANLWIEPTSGKGLRRIDPRELPAELRARPATSLAYQFADQPFDLALRVESSPPLVRTEARTTIQLGANRAKVDAWLDYQTARGRLFEVKVALPRGLELESVGPDEIVESSKLAVVAPGVSGVADGTRFLNVGLKPKAREQGAFSLHLVGRQSIDPSRPVAASLFRPCNATPVGGRAAVVADRNLTVDLPDGADGSIRPAHRSTPADWPWPIDEAHPPALWLLYDDDPPAIPLRVAVHPRSVGQETTLLAEVGRREAAVRQETDCTIQFGTLDRLVVLVPAELSNRWSVEGGDLAEREELGIHSSGGRLVRLKLASPATDRLRLTFLYRLPISTPLRPAPPTAIPIPWIQLLETTAGPMRVRVASENGVHVVARGEGWTSEEASEPGQTSESSPPVRLAVVHDRPDPSPLTVKATADRLAPLPDLVVSRHWLRTVQSPEGTLHGRAWYWVERHAGSLPLALPPGAVWERARVGGEAIDQIETITEETGHRLNFPSQWARRPVLVEVEYSLPASAASPPWLPPRLLDDGLIQETLWEARLPWNRAVVGVPPGWTDENQWHWDGYVWKRRPWRQSASLLNWVGGPSARAREADSFEEPERRDDHSYLFSRPGPVSELRLTVVSRAWLVAVCSGSVLCLGSLLLVVWRPPARLLALGVAAVVLAACSALHPSVTILALQSSLIGAVLTILAAVMQWLIERGRRTGTVFGESSTIVTAPAIGSSVSRPMDVGSDDSTAIRIRPNSTVDFIVTGPGPGPSPSSAESKAGRGPLGSSGGKTL